jgi:F0F1-type ATP synthase beta subunit
MKYKFFQKDGNAYSVSIDSKFFNFLLNFWLKRFKRKAIKKGVFPKDKPIESCVSISFNYIIDENRIELTEEQKEELKKSVYLTNQKIVDCMEADRLEQKERLKKEVQELREKAKDIKKTELPKPKKEI